MDKAVIETKLESLMRCVNRINEQRISSAEELKDNLDKQDIIILNLQRAVQICVDIGNHLLLDFDTPAPSTMAETFSLLAKNRIISGQLSADMSRAVGFRNIAENIDSDIIYTIITNRLDDFKNYAAAISKLL